MSKTQKKYKLKKFLKGKENSPMFEKIIKKVKKGFFSPKEEEKTYGTYAPYYKSSYYSCHTGTVEVFIDPQTGIKIKAGGDMRDVKVSKDDLLLDCGADFKRYKEVKEYKNPIIVINIPNGGIPRMALKFWEDLVDIIRNEKKDTLIACLGGHGRTGVCLSMLAYLMDVPGAKENPIEFIRKNYCKKAVESVKQFDYIKTLLNLDIEKPELHYEKTYSTQPSFSYF